MSGMHRGSLGYSSWVHHGSLGVRQRNANKSTAMARRQPPIRANVHEKGWRSFNAQGGAGRSTELLGWSPSKANSLGRIPPNQPGTSVVSMEGTGGGGKEGELKVWSLRGRGGGSGGWRGTCHLLRVRVGLGIFLILSLILRVTRVTGVSGSLVYACPGENRAF